MTPAGQALPELKARLDVYHAKFQGDIPVEIGQLREVVEQAEAAALPRWHHSPVDPNDPHFCEDCYELKRQAEAAAPLHALLERMTDIFWAFGTNRDGLWDYRSVDAIDHPTVKAMVEVIHEARETLAANPPAATEEERE